MSSLKTIALSCALLLLAPMATHAAGVDLTTTSCPTSGTHSVVNDCAGGGVGSLLGTIVMPEAMADLVAIDAQVTFDFGPNPVPTFWDFQYAGSSVVSSDHRRPSTGCASYTNTFSSAGSGSGFTAVTGPHSVVVGVDCYRPSNLAVAGGQKIFAFRLDYDGSQSMESGGGSLAGCAAPVCVYVDWVRADAASGANLIVSGSAVSGDYVAINGVSPPFTLTATAGAGGTVVENGFSGGPDVQAAVHSFHAAQGGSRTFTVSAQPGFAILNVLVDGVSVGAVPTYTFTNVLANHTIAATFAPVTNGVDLNADHCPNTGSHFPFVDCSLGSAQVLVGTIVMPAAMPDLVATDAQVTFDFGAGPVPEFWDFQTANLGGLNSSHLRPSGCGSYTNTFNPGGSGSGFNTTTGAHSVTALVTCYRPSQLSVVAGQKIFGFSLIYDTSNSTEGGGFLGGCSTPVCVYVDWVRVDALGGANQIVSGSAVSGDYVAINGASAPFTLTATAGAGGTVVESGFTSIPDAMAAVHSFHVAPGGDRSFGISAQPGFGIRDVLVDGVSVGPASSYGFADVQANHTIAATFACEAFTDIAAALDSVSSCAVAWGDYDNDGDLDVLLAGSWNVSAAKFAKIYRNSGGSTPSFTDIGAELTAVTGQSSHFVAWGDYDGDGDLDLVLAGTSASGLVTKIYRNNGGPSPTFTDIGASLPGLGDASVAWGDYDNDGHLDLLLAGNTGTGTVTRIYRNSGAYNPTFTDIGAGLAGIDVGTAAWGDYDNDGDLDIVETGNNPTGLTKVYRNNGGPNPTFTDIGGGLPNLILGDAAWGDYDNDGDLDILLTGYVTPLTVLRNSGGPNPTFTDIGAGLATVSYASAAWGDYDNDGNLDILVTGTNGSQLSKIYRNRGGSNPTFVEVPAGLVGVAESSVAWGDFDNDGDLDVLLAGERAPGPPLSAARIYRNTTCPANTPPTAPTNLTATPGASGVRFSWNAATDAQAPAAALTYNLRVGTTPGGNDVLAAMASPSGYRRIVRLGNVNHNIWWTLNLPPGAYWWSVQAVDGAFAGSSFAGEQSLVVPADTLTVAPDFGGDEGAVTVAISGSGFHTGTVARLARAAQADIVGSSTQISADGHTLTTTLGLTARVPGAWDVIVDYPDGRADTLHAAFTIQSTAAPQLRVALVGPPFIRAARRTSYDVVIENPGNVDAVDVPLWIYGVPLGDTIALGVPLAYPPRVGGEPDWTSVPLALSSAGGQYVPLVIPRIPPGTMAVRFYFISRTQTSRLRVAVSPPWLDGNVFRSCLSNGGISNPACMGAQLTANQAYLAGSPSIEAMSGVGFWAKIAWQCEGSASLPAALTKAEQALDFMIGPIESSGSAFAACSGALPPIWRDSLLVTIVGAIDPNAKFGANGNLTVQQAVPYSIHFENDSSATAPAQQVIVHDPLNLGTFDPATVSLDAITFGSVRVPVLAGLSHFATTVDLRPAKNLIVNVGADLDLFGVLTWYFKSIDPATGDLPLDPFLGFLPANRHPPEGEGTVLFTVTPRSSLGGGAQVLNRGIIAFDTNPPESTATWSNIISIDNTPPTSHVLPLATRYNTTSIPVSWTANGAPTDLRDFTIYVSEDGATYRPWRTNTTTTSDTLVPPNNHRAHTYSFYSQARDLAGNTEPANPGAAVSTQSLLAVEGAPALELALEGARPNPAFGAMHVWFTLPDRQTAWLELIDVAGRRVFRRDVSALGPGSHVMTLDTGPRMRPGLYFLRLAQGGRVLKARVAWIR